MLRRALALASAAGVVVGVLLPATAAFADYVFCEPYSNECYVIVETPGDPGGDGGGGTGGGNNGSEPVCHGPHGNQVDCYDEGRGWYDPTTYCWWRESDPQPPAGDPEWQGHDPSEGVVYQYWCPYNLSPGMGPTGSMFQATPPPGFGGLPSPASLAAQAISQLPIKGAEINTAPDVNGAGLVGLPVWLWTAATAATWGPQTATASVPGLSVTATANAEKVEWRMGDGHAVVCTSPGVVYQPSYGAQPSPDCGYQYRRSSRSQPEGRYTITAVTTWHVVWSGGGQNGALDVTRQTTSTIKIDELQVVTR